MKQLMTICDVCADAILSKDDEYSCSICGKDVCEDCSSVFLKEIFSAKVIICCRCEDIIMQFKKEDYNKFKDTFYNPIMEMIKKMVIVGNLNNKEEVKVKSSIKIPVACHNCGKTRRKL